MIVEYLTKIRSEFENQLELCRESLAELDLRYKENKRFIALIEEKDDPFYEAFSPRHVNHYQKLKLQDLYEEQKKIMSQIEQQNNTEMELIDKIKEIDMVIEEAKRLEVR